MQVVGSFDRLLHQLAPALTGPTFTRLHTLLIGWVFANHRTVTGMIRAAHAVDRAHFSLYHRVFGASAMCVDRMGLIVFGLILKALPDDAEIPLSLDDTLAHKRGAKVFGVGMHHDPQLSSRRRTVTSWGHSWVVLCVVVRLPFAPDRAFSLPVLSRLYLNTAAAERDGAPHLPRPQLAVQMVHKLCASRPQRRFHLVGDSAYSGAGVVGVLPGNCHFTGRLHPDARLYEPAPRRAPGTNGRPRVRGARLPSPRRMLAERTGREIKLDIYGRRSRVRVVEAEARVYKLPGVPLRVVAVEDLDGGRGVEAFFSTKVEEAAGEAAEQVLVRYADRWSIEVTFKDAKQSLGVEQPQGWSEKAARRTAPVGLLMYSLIVLWFAEHGHARYRKVDLPWYRHKPHPSFADMLGTLRRQSVKQTLLKTPLRGPGSRKVMRIIDTAFAAAA